MSILILFTAHSLLSGCIPRMLLWGSCTAVRVVGRWGVWGEGRWEVWGEARGSRRGRDRLAAVLLQGAVWASSSEGQL